MRRLRNFAVPLALLILAALACTSPLAPARPSPTPRPTSTPYPTQTLPAPIPSATALPTATALPGPFGPTGFPPNVNPLTGQIVGDPSVLNRRPLLVKVSNESPKVRPQSGLSFADHVWEYQMEGYAYTRFTAVYYGQTPDKVGSVRSTRLIDVEHLMYMYDGILATSGGSTNLHDPGGPPRIIELLRTAPWGDRVVSEWYVRAAYSDPYLVRDPGIPVPHNLFAIPSAIWQLATQKGWNKKVNLEGLAFNYTPPGGGQPTTQASIDYPGRGPKHTWTYNPATNKWLSSTEDQGAGTPDAPDFDKLTNQQLAFDNVVIVYAQMFDANFIEEEASTAQPVQLNSVHVNLAGEGQCVLLRDGQRFDCIWRRADKGGMMQFFDPNNNPLPFKPGNTWFNVASSNVAKPAINFAP